jgi:CheY-like chemotaxis protein
MKSEFSPAPTRWILVDDDGAIRETIAKLLAAIAGVEVTSYFSGAAALGAFAAAPDTFDFIVSDLDMPGMSGIEFCRCIKTVRPQMKLLLATGSGLITQEEAIGFGFCGMINKPFSVAALRRALADAEMLGFHQPDQAGVAPVCIAA